MQCDYFDAGRCRSCTLMGTPYDEQLAAKQHRAAVALADVAPRLEWLDPARSPASHYRNKAKLVVGGRAGHPTLGILDERGRGVDLRRCGLYEPGLSATFDPLHRFVADLRLEPYDVPARRGELKYLIVTHSPDGEHLVRFVLRSDRHLADLRAALPRLLADLPSVRVVTANLHPEHKAVLEGETEVPLTEQTLLPMRVGDATLLLGPRSFFQTNTAVAGALYRQAAATGSTTPTPTHGAGTSTAAWAGSPCTSTAPGRTVRRRRDLPDAVDAARAAARLHTDAAAGIRPVPAPSSSGTRRRPPLAPPRTSSSSTPRAAASAAELAAWLDALPARPRRLLQLQRRPRWPATWPRCRRWRRHRPGLRHVPADDRTSR